VPILHPIGRYVHSIQNRDFNKKENSMTELKTKPTQASVKEYLNAIPNENTRQDCWKIVELMQQATGAAPRMWGASIIGFGSYHYKYASGREADWMLVGFSPRKQNITLYIMAGFEHYDQLLAQLGKHTHAKSCLYIKRLSDLHLPTLEKLIQASVTHMRETNPPGAV
jgi:hypothetical protein